MPRIDPQQLLKTLGVLLSPTGGIKSTEEVERIVTLMRKFSTKLVSKCIYVQILNSTDRELLGQFLDKEGWSLLNGWFAEAVQSGNWAYCLEILGLLDYCPISAERLRATSPDDEKSAPRLINKLRNHPEAEAEVLQSASKLYQKWVALIEAPKEEESAATGANSVMLLQNLAEEVSENLRNEAKKEKKDKKDKHHDSKNSHDKQHHHHHHHHHHHKSSKDKVSSSPKDGKERDERRKRKEDQREHRDHHRERKRPRPDRRDEVDPAEKQRIKDIARRLKEEEQSKKDKDTLKKVGGSLSMSKMPKIPKKSSSTPSTLEKNSSGGGMSFEAMLGGLDQAKPKTVKTPMAKNKTAALLEGLKSTSKASSSPSSKHHSNKKEKDPKKDAHHSGPSAPKRDISSTTTRNNKDAEKKLAPLKMPDNKRKSSIDDAESPKSAGGGGKVKSPHNVHESSGFMEAIMGSMDMPKRKKIRRSSENEQLNKKPAAEKEEEKVKEEVNNPPAAFSFYRDTLETPEESDQDKKPNFGKAKKEKSPTPVLDDEDSNSKSKSGSGSPKSPEGPREVKGILVFHRGRDRVKRKLTWRPDSDLVAVKHFELNEDERVNVNKIKFENMRDMELKMEKAAIKSKGAINESPEQPSLQWYTPKKVLVTNKEKFVSGAKSLERDAQAAREKNVLQALYFSKEMTPPSPAEPDAEQFIRQEPSAIPMDDQVGDVGVSDCSKNGWPQPKLNQVDQQANFESSFSLPPALSNLLNNVNLNSFLQQNQNPSAAAQQPTSASGQPLSREEQDILNAQTEALKALGILPGVDVPPSFPPPIQQQQQQQQPQQQQQQQPPMARPPPNFNQPPPFDTNFPPPHHMNGPPPPPPFNPMSGPPPPHHHNHPPPQHPNGFHGHPPPDFHQQPFGRGGGNAGRFNNGGGRGGFGQGPPPNHRGGGFRGGNNRTGGGGGGGGGGGFRGGHRPQDDHKIKTKPCVFFVKGYCKDGDRCRYIHEGLG